jgi:hypothetical protein
MEDFVRGLLEIHDGCGSQMAQNGQLPNQQGCNQPPESIGIVVSFCIDKRTPVEHIIIVQNH